MEKNTDELKKIAYNCRQATYWMEKKQLDILTLPEKMALAYHLAGCSVCRLFEQQSRLITRLAHRLFQASSQYEVKLDVTYKQQLQERINEKINRLD